MESPEAKPPKQIIKKCYTYSNTESTMVPDKSSSSPVKGGQGFNKNEVVKHLRQLKGLSYEVICNVISSNVSVAQTLTKSHPQFIPLLMKVSL
jgi:hypothetical protein